MPPNQTYASADSITDYLTCGGCALEFPLQNITNFIQHKKVGCLDSSVSEPTAVSGFEGSEEKALLCYTCSRDFMTARGLLQHIQLSHNLKVFLQPGEEHGQTNRQTDTTEAETDKTQVQPYHPWTRQSSVSEDSSVVVKKSCDDGDNKGQGQIVQMTSSRGESENSFPDDGFEGEGRCGQMSGHCKQMTGHCKQMTSHCKQMAGHCKRMAGHCKRMRTVGGGRICCNRQECCVTIIPGTHERPKKCCSAVVPKKRTQHMAEHMSGNIGEQESSDHESSDRESDQNEDNETTEEDSNSNSIFIDFHPQFRNYQENLSKNDGKDETNVNTHQSSFNLSHSVGNENENFEVSGIQEVTEPDSIIMHPGKTYSIPVSYGYSESDLRILNNSSIKIFPQTLNEMEPSASFTLQTSTVSSVGDIKDLQTAGTCRQQNSVELTHTVSQSSPITTPAPVESSASYAVPSHEAELDDSDKEDEMEIDDSLHDRGRKRRYPTSRPFKCNECDNAFNQRIHLKKHMSKHTGVKPFKCAQCNYSTVERSHLKVHIRIHTGEKPFKCTYCKYATAQNSTLKIHLKRHHNGRMLECEECSQKFTQHEMLTSHRMGHQMSGLPSQPISAADLTTDRSEPLNPTNRWTPLTAEPISTGQQSVLGPNQFQEVYELTNQNVGFPGVIKNSNSNPENS